MNDLLIRILENAEIHSSEKDLQHKPSTENNIFIKINQYDIDKLATIIPIPKDLQFFWENVGYGFIQYGFNKKKTSEINRLLDPLSIYEILTHQSEQVSENFIVETGKIPFFECSSEYFLYFDVNDITQTQQPVFWYFNDEKVAYSLKDFFEKIFNNPNYLYE